MPKGVACSVASEQPTLLRFQAAAQRCVFAFRLQRKDVCSLSGCNAKMCGHAWQDILMAICNFVCTHARVNSLLHTLIHSSIPNILCLNFLRFYFWVYFGCICECMSVYCYEKVSKNFAQMA